jgi:SAM-dependent methyltransferase
MDPRKQPLQAALRNWGILQAVDDLRFLGCWARNYRRNRAFLKANKNFPVPPHYIAYDAYGNLDWNCYKQSGLDGAEFLSNLIRKHLPAGGNERVKVLEWGCGAARILRHLPLHLGEQYELTGSDYNEHSIAWCRRNIPNARFVQNRLTPPLPFADDSFDAVYALSVLTHLSEELNFAWLNELIRVTRKDGIILLTIKGDSYRNVLLAGELRAFNDGELVVRDRVKEGKKMFGAFHSSRFVRNCFLRHADVVLHVPDGFPHMLQDVWLIRNNKPLSIIPSSRSHPPIEKMIAFR